LGTYQSLQQQNAKDAGESTESKFHRDITLKKVELPASVSLCFKAQQRHLIITGVMT